MVQESDNLKRFDDAGSCFGRLEDADNTPTETKVSRSPDEIRADMCRTRAEIGNTVDTLQDQLRPEVIMHRMLGSCQNAAGKGAVKVLNVIKENPLPATVIAAGLVMLMTRRKSGGVHSWPSGRAATVRPPELDHEPSFFAKARDAVSHTFSNVSEKVGDFTHGSVQKVKGAAGSVSERLHDATYAASDTMHRAGSSTREGVSHLQSQVRDRASQVGDQVRDGAKHVRDGAKQSAQWMDEMVHEYPMAAGAACFALGLASGFALPGTRKESELVGETRDRLMREARAKGVEMIHKGEELAEKAVQRVTAAVECDDRNQSQSESSESFASSSSSSSGGSRRAKSGSDFPASGLDSTSASSSI